MSNQRETIISYFPDLLEGIKVSNGYNTSPVVERKSEHFYNTNNFPSLFIQEGEREEIGHFTFDSESAYLNLTILGRTKGTFTDLNKLIEDVRIRLGSIYNDYGSDTDVVDIMGAFDPESDLKQFSMKVRVFYTYTLGSA